MMLKAKCFTMELLGALNASETEIADQFILILFNSLGGLFFSSLKDTGEWRLNYC